MRRARNRSLFWKLRQRAVRRISALRARMRRQARPGEVELATVQVRLEHYLRAIYGRTIRVEEFADTLPPTLAPSGDGVSAFEQYRCLAVQRAERLVRLSAGHASELQSNLERDLFELAESVSVDQTIAATQPGLARSLTAGRAAALRARTPLAGATALEREVERLAQAALANRPGAPNAPVPVAPDAEASVGWARRVAAELTRNVPARLASRYRRVAPLGIWRTEVISGDATTIREQLRDPSHEAPLPPASSSRPSRIRLPWVGPPDQIVARENPGGGGPEQQSTTSSNPDPRVDARPDDAGEGASGSEPSPDGAADPNATDERETRGSSRQAGIPRGEAYHYREWDLYAKVYHREPSVVRVSVPAASKENAPALLGERHAVLVRQVRDRFAQLRAHRQRLYRQPNGDEIDLESWVTAAGDVAAGQTPDDRFYATVRATRQAIAILLLIDVSASTRAQIDSAHRVIDIERIAALLAAEAFDALGDPYAILAFSSDGRADVRVSEIKRFAGSASGETERRLATLEPANATRLGAALRHATAMLAGRAESHRLLLILSDGRPNDRDGYIDEDYAVEDSRRAVSEARVAGVTPYCITVDPEEPREYMEHIFGEQGYRVLAETAHLPAVLLRAVQGLLRR